MTSPVPPFPPDPWLWLLGGAVALVVSLIAFLVASGLVRGRADHAAPRQSRRAPRNLPTDS